MGERVAGLTADLIRFPTVNPPGDAYRPCAEYLGRTLEELGVTMERIVVSDLAELRIDADRRWHLA